VNVMLLFRIPGEQQCLRILQALELDRLTMGDIVKLLGGNRLILVRAGFQNIVNIAGGMGDWKEQHLPR
jgi:hypothetical protein